MQPNRVLGNSSAQKLKPDRVKFRYAARQLKIITLSKKKKNQSEWEGPPLFLLSPCPLSGSGWSFLDQSLANASY